jgi:hypothetical protein
MTFPARRRARAPSRVSSPGQWPARGVCRGRKGKWGKAVALPGIGALSAGHVAELGGLSCPSADNCTAGGYYLDGSGHQQAFVASQRKGKWGKAAEVRGTAKLNKLGMAGIAGLACASAGNCSADGFYGESASRREVFVVTESGGTWGKAQEIPGSAARNAGGAAEDYGISCPAAGDCMTGGYYTDAAHHGQAFVVSQHNGKWGSAIEVPGSGVLNAGHAAETSAVSCGSAGNCSISGSYTDGAGHGQAFVATWRKGKWKKAEEVPGLAKLNKDGAVYPGSLSCATAGNCVAAGAYLDGSGHFQVFEVIQRAGTWRTAVEVPGAAKLNVDGEADVYQVARASPGNCALAGYYRDKTGHFGPFTADVHSWRRRACGASPRWTRTAWPSSTRSRASGMAGARLAGTSGMAPAACKATSSARTDLVRAAARLS